MIGEVTAYTLARSLAIAIAAVGSGLIVARVLSSVGHGQRRLAWALLLVPLFTPALLVGYAYSNFALSLVHYPQWNSLFYGVLVWMRLTPLAALALHLAPREVSDAGMHCYSLTKRVGRDRRARREVDIQGDRTGVPQVSQLAVSQASEPARGASHATFSRFGNLRHGRLGSLRYGTERAAFWLRGNGRPVMLAFTLVFLMAFAEFEMASLLMVKSWTVMLFDAQVGGMLLSASLLLARVPLLIGFAVFVMALWLVLRTRVTDMRAGATLRSPHRGVTWLAWGYLAISVTVIAAVPAAIVLGGAVTGMRVLVSTFVIGKELTVSLVFSALAAVLALATAGAVLRWVGKWAAAVICLPGLLGPLLAGLWLVWLFQLPGLRALYDTPVLLVAGFVLLLLPMAVLLLLILRMERRTTALHGAQLMMDGASDRLRRHGAAIRWMFDTRRYLWAGMLLFCWAYFDVTAAHMLAPVGMTPVTVRLYNQMHYGQSAVLSATVCVAFLVPVGVAALGVVLGRWMTGTRSK